MRNIIHMFLVFVFSSSWFLACSTENEDRPDVVAQVNNALMTNAELEQTITDVASPDIKMAIKRKLMEKWIEDEIFFQEAITDGVSLTPYEENLILNYKKRLMIEKYLSKYLNKNYRVLDQEIEDYYSNHRREFVWDADYVNIIHLVLENDERVIRNEIRASKDLMEVITKNFFDQKSTSERPIGNLGYVRVSDLPAGLVSRAFAFSSCLVNSSLFFAIPVDSRYFLESIPPCISSSIVVSFFFSSAFIFSRRAFFFL